MLLITSVTINLILVCLVVQMYKKLRSNYREFAIRRISLFDMVKDGFLTPMGVKSNKDLDVLELIITRKSEEPWSYRLDYKQFRLEEQEAPRA